MYCDPSGRVYPRASTKQDPDIPHLLNSTGQLIPETTITSAGQSNTHIHSLAQIYSESMHTHANTYAHTAWVCTSSCREAGTHTHARQSPRGVDSAWSGMVCCLEINPAALRGQWRNPVKHTGFMLHVSSTQRLPPFHLHSSQRL